MGYKEKLEELNKIEKECWGGQFNAKTPEEYNKYSILEEENDEKKEKLFKSAKQETIVVQRGEEEFNIVTVYKDPETNMSFKLSPLCEFSLSIPSHYRTLKKACNEVYCFRHIDDVKLFVAMKDGKQMPYDELEKLVDEDKYAGIIAIKEKK